MASPLGSDPIRPFSSSVSSGVPGESTPSLSKTDQKIKALASLIPASIQEDMAVIGRYRHTESPFEGEWSRAKVESSTSTLTLFETTFASISKDLIKLEKEIYLKQGSPEKLESLRKEIEQLEISVETMKNSFVSIIAELPTHETPQDLLPQMEERVIVKNMMIEEIKSEVNRLKSTLQSVERAVNPPSISPQSSKLSAIFARLFSKKAAMPPIHLAQNTESRQAIQGLASHLYQHMLAKTEAHTITVEGVNYQICSQFVVDVPRSLAINGERVAQGKTLERPLEEAIKKLRAMGISQEDIQQLSYLANQATAQPLFQFLVAKYNPKEYDTTTQDYLIQTFTPDPAKIQRVITTQNISINVEVFNDPLEESKPSDWSIGISFDYNVRDFSAPDAILHSGFATMDVLHPKNGDMNELDTLIHVREVK